MEGHDACTANGGHAGVVILPQVATSSSGLAQQHAQLSGYHQVVPGLEGPVPRNITWSPICQRFGIFISK